jgi:hypothetical protein
VQLRRSPRAPAFADRRSRRQRSPWPNAAALASEQERRRAKINGIDSLILYTTGVERFWAALRDVAERTPAVTFHHEPPEAALEVGEDCRLYVSVEGLQEPVPPAVRDIGRDAREVVIDRHNRVPAEAFLADVLDCVRGLVDADDNGQLMSTATFVAAVRAGRRP